MAISQEICDMIEKEVDAGQLLSELKIINKMTKEELECFILKHGSTLGMKKILEKLPKYDDWQKSLILALSSENIGKPKIAKKFAKTVNKTKEHRLDDLLCTMDYFSCLENLNDPPYLRHNWKDLAKELDFTPKQILDISKFDGNFMQRVMKILADDRFEVLNYLLLALKRLNLEEEYKCVLVQAGLKHTFQHTLQHNIQGATSQRNHRADSPSTSREMNDQKNKLKYFNQTTKSSESTKKINNVHDQRDGLINTEKDVETIPVSQYQTFNNEPTESNSNISEDEDNNINTSEHLESTSNASENNDSFNIAAEIIPTPSVVDPEKDVETIPVSQYQTFNNEPTESNSNISEDEDNNINTSEHLESTSNASENNDSFNIPAEIIPTPSVVDQDVTSYINPGQEFNGVAIPSLIIGCVVGLILGRYMFSR